MVTTIILAALALLAGDAIYTRARLRLRGRATGQSQRPAFSRRRR